MLGVFIGYFFCLLGINFVGKRRLFFMVGYSCCFLSFLSLFFYSNCRVIIPFFSLDVVSYPLLVLRCLIIFLSVLARGNFRVGFGEVDMKGYYFSLLLVGFFLFPCFLVKTFFSFFIFFEASVIPLLVLITRWGRQKERVQASFYFVFYTLVGSYPLLVFLFYFYRTFLSSFMGVESLRPLLRLPGYCYMGVFGSFDLFFFWWLAMVGFLIKLPIYGFHLWLPKAHVEAPVAGSMLLAALLLKLGGYGLIRIMGILQGRVERYIVPFCFIGSLVTRVICFRQADLKALIAYSSVGHMRLVAGGVVMKTC